MAPTIQVKQNQSSNLKLLAAQRQLYSEAKRSLTLRLWIALLLLLFPFVSTFVPALNGVEPYFALGGLVFLALTYFYFKRREDDKVELAAQTQELFDIAVLGVPDNPLPFEHEPAGLDIQRAAERHLAGFGIRPDEHFLTVKEEDWKKMRLLNWYAVPSNFLPSRAALFCQKSNLLWDYRQRKFYMNLFLLLSLGVFIVPLTIACFFGFSALDYVKKLLSLSLPFLILCLENWRGHAEIVSQQEQKAYSLNTFLNSKQEVSPEFLRITQNVIFENRKKNALVPDWLYRQLRNRQFEDDMQTDANIQQ